MKRIFFGLFIMLAVLLSGCVRNEVEGDLDIRTKMVFAAHTEQGDLITKTTLDGEVGDQMRYIKWNPQDSIGISSGYRFEKFVNISTEVSETGLFEGYISKSENYYAVYPYNKDIKLTGALLNIILPTVQKYQENTFGADCFPMVSRKGIEDDFSFMNLCGIFVLRMTGDFSVKSITFTAKDESGNYMKVSGGASIDMSYVRTPEMIMADDASNRVVLDCGDGVQLSSSESIPFHIVLPVGTYSTFTISVVSTSGHIYIKEGTAPLNIKRSIATKSGVFTPIEETVVDLSNRGTANCYIVSEKGTYSLDATVIGNGQTGIVANSNFHTESAEITPASADLLWATSESLITSVAYESASRRISVRSSGGEGNAVIAARDEEGNIIWSWHIWCTDEPEELVYPNNAGIMMDRNLGATSAEAETLEALGLFYQWGRKDPFIGSSSLIADGWDDIKDDAITFPPFPEPIYTPEWGNIVNGITPIHRTILDPMKFYVSYNGDSDWFPNAGSTRWGLEKTIYDPCPVGWKVPDGGPEGIWSRAGFNENYIPQSGEHGVSIQLDNEITTWYPCPGYRDSGTQYGEIIYAGEEGGYWSVTESNSSERNYLFYVAVVNANSDMCRSNGYSVRCMKDDGFIDAALPVVAVKEIKEISATTATLVGEVVSAGNGEVTDRGFILGLTPDISLDNGTVYKCESGIGEYSLPLEELTSLTKYYVKAYAVNEYGTSYSQVQSFMTDYEGEAINLSVDGTANSYLVRDQGRDFIFDCRLKGNSPEVIEAPSSVEVLWETKNTQESVSKGDIISSVSLIDGGFVQFSIPNEYTPGNAVIAVKDANGVILWSWHIWVTDFDPVSTQQTYMSGAVMMDRNLGALNVQEKDPRAYGLLYQWGRKDPMRGVADESSFVKTCPEAVFTNKSTSSINDAIHNPTDFGSTSSWYSDNTLWQEEKTKYDPCPVGWRVPDGGINNVWQGFESYSHITFSISAYFDAPYSTPRAFYPLCGSASVNEINHYGSSSNYWSTSASEETASGFWLWLGDASKSAKRKDSFSYVRCQKDESQSAVFIPAVQIKEVKDVTQNSVTVVSEVVRDGRSSVIEKGVLVGETPDLTIENALKVVKSESEEKEFTLTVNDLLDGTKYYVRSYAKNSAGIGYSESRSFTTPFGNIVEDLCVYGTANSYIVTQTGTYKIKPVKGNSLESVGEVHSAEVLWETFGSSVAPREGDLISSVGYKDGYVIFKVHDPYKEGNAVIAAKDENGTILWSWHIWLTDQPQEHIYPNNAGTMMDRNLGATSATPGDVGALGLFYQWGRKDPFLGSSSITTSVQASSTGAWGINRDSHADNIGFTINNPNTLLFSDYSSDVNMVWNTSKTITDPCPLGWRIPEGGFDGFFANAGFEQDEEDRTNKGSYYLLSDGILKSWFPYAGHIDENTGMPSRVGERRQSYYWTVSDDGETSGVFNPEWVSNTSSNRKFPHSVRCLKDVAYITESMPSVDLLQTSDITTSSVVIKANVFKSGIKPVIERGVIYSESSGVTLDKGTVVKEGDGLGEFAVTLTGLKPATHYYIRSYAKSDMGVSYSDEVRVITLNDGTYHDLSINGTANSYIVNKYGYYSFNATVKGNSTTPLEATPVSAEVLWETRNTSESITVGCVVKDVTFEDGKVKFRTTEDVTPGNALIAVKDTDGYILWSWHIWVVDYNPEVQYHSYPSGAVMMDRDLGALNNQDDYFSLGLLYQWGRKDPFMAPVEFNVEHKPATTAPENVIKYQKTNATKGTLAFVEANPTIMLHNDISRQDWLYITDNTLWNENKTMYDPCPSGWQVPSAKDRVWDRLEGVPYIHKVYLIDNTNAVFGGGGWTSTSCEDNVSAYEMNGDRGKLSPSSVRCTKITNFSVNHSIKVISDRSVTLLGNAVSTGAKTINERGILYTSDLNSSQNYMTISSGHNNIKLVKDDNITNVFGEFEVYVEDLIPNTQYYIRAYVITERGIEYSDVSSFYTKVSSGNEDFGDEDYEW